jgi:amino acid adenylation domain-containing protein
MKHPSMSFTHLPPEQEAIRAKCFHPSGTFVEFSKEDVETSIPARFEKIVRKHANRLAVKMGDESLTYDELNRYANRIAHTILDRRGPGSEPIGLFLGKSIDLIAAIFGVLKAGKFYVVLDPSFPDERLQYLLNDSGSNLVVTDRCNLAAASKLTVTDQAVLSIAIDNEAHSPENLNLCVLPHDPVCIQYTSGSTGTPKGVVELHQNVLQSVRWMSEEIQVHADDRFSLLHSLSFGSGYVNLRLSLLNGASLFGFDANRESIEQLGRWIRDERITILHLPPTLFRQLAEPLPSGGIHPDLRLIRLSGAPITKSDFELYKSRFVSVTRLRIAMGSTEARGICAAIVDQKFSFPTDGVPIGYPRPGNKILFLDEAGDEVAPGEMGEIAVKGENLNPGYWRKPLTTDDSAIHDPQGGIERIHRTGDLGRMLPDGFVVHLGRKDFMVKIRGYRVDISEVERALLEHPGIKDGGVKVWEREPGEKYLAGYIVPREGYALNVSEVREFFRGKLPEYMIPSAFKLMATLPLTNGKLDRQALPRPDTQRPALKQPYVAPRGEVERKLAGIWAEVLQIDEVGIHDNFFDLGGHSLTATRVISRVLAGFQAEVSQKLLFESPTVAALARSIEDALRQSPSETNLPLVPAPRGTNLPASFGQRGLWFHNQLDPESCAYNLVFSYRLSGELDVQLMEQSINQIVARHEVLRMVFEAVDGQPVQNILPVMTIGLEVIDLSNLVAESLQDSEVRRFAGVLAEQSFDLTRGPLLRPALLRLASNEYVFLLAVHHIVFDGWSIGVFSRELSQIYNSLRSGKPCPFPELRIQYADFSMWQRERLRDANLENSLSYWKNQLDNLPTLMLPIKRVQHIPERASGGREEFEVSDELLDLLRSLANRSGTTLFMVLLAAWKVALYRYTGQTDIAIGTPVAGRNHPAVEELIGYFLNLVVLRSDLSGNPTVLELLERIRRVCLDAFAHQDVPFEKLVEELRPTRRITTNPLVQATFALQNTPQQSLNLTGITARDLDISAGVARPFDLHLYVIEEERRLRGYVSYNINLFEADTIKRLINHLTNLLTAIAVDQDERISVLPMLTEQEKHQLLVGWNDSEAEYPNDKCIHQLFEEQVEKTPDAVAVVFQDQQLTYRELNSRANQLAHYLKRLGGGPERLVAICMKRSLEMVVGLLGILKSGSAYVPLDPSHPAERLEFMLADAQVSVLLTQESLLEDGGSRMDDSDCRSSILSQPMQRICLDRDWEMIARESDANPENTTTVDNLAYVIYTSGSTGQPKGVQITHKSLLNLVFWHHQAFSVTPMDRATQLVGPGFDAAVWELWPYLTVGATVHIPDDMTRLDAAALRDWLVTQAITIGFVPTALAENLMTLDWLPETALRILLTGGDALRVYPSDTLPFRVFNNYGPTECTVVTTSAQVWPNAHPLVPPTIGRPIANSQVYILDAYRNPVPIGVVGEIYIGGDGVARGYLNRPELTAERFISHFFDEGPGQRLYKTGDLARYLPDGNIEFIGRADNQVKIRGYRIELDEIETMLRSHPAVRQCAVAAREDTPGDKWLIGYVVMRTGAQAKVDELRDFIKQKLPDYMIPSAWVCLDELPLLPNGKVDRRALPIPGQDGSELEKPYEAPRTPTEVALANVWREVLNIDKVSVHDNFFDLGGHSLLATQVLSRIRQSLEAEVPLRAIFEAPTIKEMALAIAAHQAKAARQKDLEWTLREVDALSEEEAELVLEGESTGRDKSKPT